MAKNEKGKFNDLGDLEDIPQDKEIKNGFWKLKTKVGRKRLFNSPQTLWKACCEYFEAVEQNPLYAGELVKYQGTSRLEAVPHMRAMSIGALCVFLGISLRTWYEYADREEFSHITTQVTQIIYNQKFEGASAELLNANIIARDLGLIEKSDVTSKGKSIGNVNQTVIVLPAKESLDDDGQCPAK
jgi:hypothetical protein